MRDDTDNEPTRATRPGVIDRTAAVVFDTVVQLRAVYLVLIAGVLLGVGIAVWGGIVSLAGKAVNTVTNAPAKKPTMTREELRPAIIGKTEDEVTAVLGKPRTTSVVNGSGTWRYNNICYDAITGKSDKETSVVFYNRVAVDIRY